MFTPVNGPASGGRSFAGDHHIAVGDGGLSLLSLGRLLQLIPGGPALGFSRVIGGESGLKPDMAGSPPATSGMKCQTKLLYSLSPPTTTNQHLPFTV